MKNKFKITEWIQFIIGIIVLISLLTQGTFDPTPYNLVWPYQGIQNWFGLPGALIAGLLFDFFGLTAYFFPIKLCFFEFKNFSFKKRIFLSIFLLFLTSSFISFILQKTEIIQIYTGLWGFITNKILTDNIIIEICSILIIAAGLLIILIKLVFNQIFLFQISLIQFLLKFSFNYFSSLVQKADLFLISLKNKYQQWKTRHEKVIFQDDF